MNGPLPRTRQLALLLILAVVAAVIGVPSRESIRPQTAPARCEVNFVNLPPRLEADSSDDTIRNLVLSVRRSGSNLPPITSADIEFSGAVRFDRSLIEIVERGGEGSESEIIVILPVSLHPSSFYAGRSALAADIDCQNGANARAEAVLEVEAGSDTPSSSLARSYVEPEVVNEQNDLLLPPDMEGGQVYASTSECRMNFEIFVPYLYLEHDPSQTKENYDAAWSKGKALNEAAIAAMSTLNQKLTSAGYPEIAFNVLTKPQGFIAGSGSGWGDTANWIGPVPLVGHETGRNLNSNEVWKFTKKHVFGPYSKGGEPGKLTIIGLDYAIQDSYAQHASAWADSHKGIIGVQFVPLAQAAGTAILSIEKIAAVLLHEIGHILGLEHTADASNLMHAFGSTHSVLTPVQLMTMVAHLCGTESSARFDKLYKKWDGSASDFINPDAHYTSAPACSNGLIANDEDVYFEACDVFNLPRKPGSKSATHACLSPDTRPFPELDPSLRCVDCRCVSTQVIAGVNPDSQSSGSAALPPASGGSSFSGPMTGTPCGKNVDGKRCGGSCPVTETCLMDGDDCQCFPKAVCGPEASCVPGTTCDIAYVPFELNEVSGCAAVPLVCLPDCTCPPWPEVSC